MYHRDIFDTSLPVESYWAASAPALSVHFPELQEDVSCEIGIVGAGYSGMHVAHRLARDHSCDVRIIEAGVPGWGASGRNGGFCCLGGSMMAWPAMISKFGLPAARAFSEFQALAVEHVRAFCRQEEIDIDAVGEGEFSLAHRPGEVEGLRAEAEFFGTKLGIEAQFLEASELAARGMKGPEFFAGLKTTPSFALHPLKYARGLAESLARAGVPLYVNSPLVGWEQDGGHEILRTPKGALRAKKIVLATNGFTPENLMPPLSGRLLPTLSNILVTRPLAPSEREEQGWTSFDPAWDTRRLLHYFRLLPDGRFMFGGRAGTRTDRASEAKAHKSLRASFERMFPAWRQAETTHFWRGLVCLSYNLLPYVGPLDETRRIWTSLAYHGSGVAMGSLSGASLADWIAGRDGAEARIPAVMRHGLTPFPLPALRLFYLRSAYLFYGLRDDGFLAA